MADSPKLIRRNDDIGRLAWKLVGSLETNDIADPSAILPLLDELDRVGDVLSATNVRTMLVHQAMRLQSDGDGRFMINPDRILNVLLESSPHLFYDVHSAVAVLTHTIEQCQKTPEVVKGEDVKMETVVARVGRFRMGRRVTLPDGRSGIILQPADNDRCVVGIVQNDDSDPGDYGEAMEGMGPVPRQYMGPGSDR